MVIRLTLSEKIQKLFDMLREHESFLAQAMTQIAAAIPVGGAADSELASVKAELEKTQNFLKGLYESLVLGDITEAEYKQLKSGYEAKITSIQTREMQLRDNTHLRVQQEKDLLKAHNSVQTIAQASDLTAEVIGRLVDKIHVCKDGRIRVKFRFMDEEAYSEGGSAA